MSGECGLVGGCFHGVCDGNWTASTDARNPCACDSDYTYDYVLLNQKEYGGCTMPKSYPLAFFVTVTIVNFLLMVALTRNWMLGRAMWTSSTRASSKYELSAIPSSNSSSNSSSKCKLDDAILVTGITILVGIAAVALSIYVREGFHAETMLIFYCIVNAPLGVMGMMLWYAVVAPLYFFMQRDIGRVTRRFRASSAVFAGISIALGIICALCVAYTPPHTANIIITVCELWWVASSATIGLGFEYHYRKLRWLIRVAIRGGTGVSAERMTLLTHFMTVFAKLRRSVLFLILTIQNQIAVAVFYFLHNELPYMFAIFSFRMLSVAVGGFGLLIFLHQFRGFQQDNKNRTLSGRIQGNGGMRSPGDRSEQRGVVAAHLEANDNDDAKDYERRT